MGFKTANFCTALWREHSFFDSFGPPAACFVCSPRPPRENARFLACRAWNFDKIASGRSWRLLGVSWARRKFYFCAFGGLPERSWDPPGANLARKRPPEAKKRPPGSIWGPFWLRKTMICRLVVVASRAAVGVTVFYICPTRHFSQFIVLCGVREKRANALRPTKTNCFFMTFRCYLLRRARARQAKITRKSNQIHHTNVIKKHPKMLKKLFLFSLLGQTSKNTSQKASQGLPGTLRGPSGKLPESPRRPQDAPRATKDGSTFHSKCHWVP